MCWEISLFLALKPLWDLLGETSAPLFSLQLVLKCTSMAVFSSPAGRSWVLWGGTAGFRFLDIPWAQLSVTAWTLCLGVTWIGSSLICICILKAPPPPMVLWGVGVILTSGVPDWWAEVLPSMSWGPECPSVLRAKGLPAVVTNP